jgi:hypothetical protein
MQVEFETQVLLMIFASACLLFSGVLRNMDLLEFLLMEAS